ncbi:hypothetical protein E5673_18560 [Sphingomonas sp. PAMC26645]|uniref:hypothetical protein n=1 Tax=Sphingomonas sp. PAMC26645 TaxID=2565555 RepID=UPI00109DF440|nr:hypothetical protein [Sphingomonas sp. PAMC26645]QCB43974.1 hypothetical protein E5673_18560 [Sphingomonas sp. PAMC26645]
MPEAGKDKREKTQLKKAVRSVVLTQGNEFIKELLRKHKVQIGTNKADFSKNLLAAIDAGTLTRPMIEEWLSEVEGWGNQHIYLFEPPKIPVGEIGGKLAGSDYAELVGTAISYAFPAELELSGVLLAADHLSLAWHKGTDGWERAPSKDFQQVDDDGELYKYNAYRQRFDRAVVRFAWRFADPYCSVMIQLPIEGETHGEVHTLVRNDLKHIGIYENDPVRIPLSEAFKAMTLKQDTVVQSTRMMTDGGHVDVVATLSEGGIADVQALREARRGVDDKSFAGTDGMFNFMPDQHPGLSRNVKVQGYGLESRVRIWVQCKREDVYQVLGVIWSNA